MPLRVRSTRLSPTLALDFEIPMKLKEFLYFHCKEIVRQRIEGMTEEIKKVQSSANEETKSSAGDKYETGRAMAQLEIDRSRGQLMEAEKHQSILQKIADVKVTETVVHGSLVSTSQGSFYIAISLGMVVLQDHKYFVVSPDSPIGKLLIGRKIGEAISWNGNPYTILTIE